MCSTVKRVSCAAAALALCLALPRAARAEAYVNPWAGVQFGSGDVNNGRGAIGVNVGAMGNGIIGGEVGFGYSPSFFGDKTEFGSNTLIDVMGNVIVGIPIGGTYGPGFRPFITGGLGLIRTQIDGGTVFTVSTSSNTFGGNIGAGAMGFINDHVGVRADIRYLRNFRGDTINNIDLGALHFWRLTAGVVIR